MARWGSVNEPQDISITHWDGRTDLYPRAHIFDINGTPVTTVDLVHRALGYYSTTWTPVVENQYVVVILTYTDALYSTLDDETQREGETYFINNLEATVDGLVVDVGNVAGDVWDEVLPGQHDLPFTSGLFMQVIRETTLQTNWEIMSDPLNSLAALEQKILDNRLILQNEINDNETKIDALTTQSSLQYLDLQSEILQNRADISVVNGNINISTANIIAEVNQNEAKIDANLAAIQQIQNNTRFVAVVPQKMFRPPTGTKRYQFFIAIYDTTGNPEAPDASPTVKIYKSDGSIFLAETTMSQDIPPKVGQYLYNLDLNAGSSEPVLRIEFKVIENGVTRYLSRVSEISEYDTQLQDIENKIDIIDTVVDSNYALLTGGNGLAVINNKLATIETEVNANETILNQIKLKTDLIISNPATTADVSTIISTIYTRPSITDIQSRLDIQTASIKGPGGYNLTDVMNNERGTDNALLANDPRLDFLDIAISSRSDHTVADIWNYATRTLTYYPGITPANIAQIWDYLVTNITTPGSIGKYILDMLDVPNSNAVTLSQLMSAIAPLALEATVSTVLSTVVNENNQNQILIQDVLDLLALIKPQTDKIVNDGARHTELVNEINQNEALLNALTLFVQQIKAKTDYLHNDIARQTDLLQIPTNPLLANDGRLSYLYYLPRLDVAVSTRAESFPTDYAKETTLTAAKNEIIGEINVNEAKINNLPSQSFIINQLVRLDTILTDLTEIMGTGFLSSEHSLVEIKNGQSPGSPGGITAADVWAYANRTLTEFPDCATTADLDAATATLLDATEHYRCNMTTTFNGLTGDQVILCWLDRNGETLVSTVNARVVVSNGVDIIWSGSDLSPDPRGIFKIVQSNICDLINDADLNFVVTITIEHDGIDFVTNQPFYTVG